MVSALLEPQSISVAMAGQTRELSWAEDDVPFQPLLPSKAITFAVPRILLPEGEGGGDQICRSCQ